LSAERKQACVQVFMLRGKIEPRGKEGSKGRGERKLFQLEILIILKERQDRKNPREPLLLDCLLTTDLKKRKKNRGERDKLKKYH